MGTAYLDDPSGSNSGNELAVIRGGHCLSDIIDRQGFLDSRLQKHWFDCFWEIYPRCADREDAWRQWIGAIRKTGPALIVACAVSYAVSCRKLNRDTQFISYPGNWLRNEQWTDEVLMLGSAGPLERI